MAKLKLTETFTGGYQGPGDDGANIFATLYSCMDYIEIDNILDSLNIDKDIVMRIAYLHKFMGTTQIFVCGDARGVNLEEEYYIAKFQLIALNKIKNVETTWNRRVK